MGTNGALSNLGVRLMIVALVGFVAVSIVVIVLGVLPLPPSTGTENMEWEQLQAEQEGLLSSYGWIDEEAGVVHIPIEEAISLQLEQGYPVREEAQDSQ